MKDLTKGPEGKVILLFTLPMLLGNVFQQLYNVVDSVIVGRFIGKEALAAVGASFPVIFLIVSLIMGFTMGSSVLVSQYFGAGKENKVKQTIETAFITLFFAGIILTILGLLSSSHILKLLNTPSDVFRQARIYLDIIFSGLIFLFGYNSLSAILRGLGDSKTPLYLLIVSTFINIVLDLIFILVFRWGIAGAAIATVLSQAVSFFGAAVYLHKKKGYFTFHPKVIKFNSEIFFRSMKIGLPSGVQQSLVSAGMMAITRIVNGFGTNAIAAFTAAGRIDSFAIMPAMNFSLALTSFVGQNIGAKKTDRIKKGVLATFLMSLSIAVCMSLIVILFGKYLLMMFNTDPSVIFIGYRYLFIVGFFYSVFTAMFLFNGALRGAGDTVIPMFITLLGMWFIRVPAAHFFSRRMGTDGIWWSIPTAWISGSILAGLYFVSGRWKKGHPAPGIEEIMREELPIE